MNAWIMVCCGGLALLLILFVLYCILRVGAEYEEMFTQDGEYLGG